MDIEQLRTVLKIEEHGHFGRAAEELGLSQPALSQRVARLEAELGRPVFDRSGRRIRLTEAGRVLKRQAERILALVEDAVREVQDDGRSGRVAVAAIPTIAPFLLPPVLRAFRAVFPEARVEADEDMTEALIKRLVEGEVDLGLLALPIDEPRLAVEPLFAERLLLAMPADHPLAEWSSVPIQVLQGESFVLLGEGHCLSEQIRGFCRDRSIQPVATGRAGQLATILELVGLGFGLSFVPEMARRVDLSPQRVYRPIEEPSPSRTIAVCWNPARYRTRLVRSFLQTLRDHRLAAAEPGASSDEVRSALTGKTAAGDSV